MGPMQVKSLGAKTYVFGCMNDYSSYTWINFIKEKSDKCGVFKMADHCVQQMISKFETSFVGSLTYFLGPQVKQLRYNSTKALGVVQFEKPKGVISICMSEIYGI